MEAQRFMNKGLQVMACELIMDAIEVTLERPCTNLWVSSRSTWYIINLKVASEAFSILKEPFVEAFLMKKKEIDAEVEMIME